MESLTHKFITSETLKNIILDCDVKKMVESSVLPDVDETDNNYAWHFYNPATKRNFRGGRITAVTKFYEHLEKSHDFYTDKVDDWEIELSRACHYVQDICTPVHTANEDIFDAITKLSLHVKFENFCNSVIEKINPIAIDDKLKKILSINDMKTLIKYNSMIANENYYRLKENADMTQIATDSINNAIILTSATIIHFKNLKGDFF